MPAPDLVLTNARLYGRAGALESGDALSVRGGRIDRIGRRRELERAAGPKTQILDAGGHAVIPGLIDAHVHLIWSYELGSWIDLSDRPSLKAVQNRVREYARAHPNEQVLVGHGFDYQALAAEGLPGRAELDEVVSDRPVLLSAWDGHTGWANSEFFRRAKPVLEAHGRETGRIVRKPGTEEPTGILEHTFDLTRHMPEFVARRSLDGLRRRLAEAVRFGITTGFDVQVNPEDLHAYEELRERNELPLRLRVGLYHPRGTPKSQYPSFMAAVARNHDDWLDVGAVKLYIDGVQETGTAALLEPYANDPKSRGSTVYPVPEYRAIVLELDRVGFQILTHACGDRGVRLALDAYEHAARSNQTRGRRHRIEHCEGVAPEDRPRFARLDVVPCMMPRHSAPELTGRWRAALGEERFHAGFPWRSLLSAHAALAFSSDWPVADLNPMVGIHEAVNRTRADGSPSDGRLSVEEAVRAYTEGAAFATHCEKDRGRLAPGFYADFLVLDRDPFASPPERIRETRVLTTVVEGVVRFASVEYRDAATDAGKR